MLTFASIFSSLLRSVGSVYLTCRLVPRPITFASPSPYHESFLISSCVASVTHMLTCTSIHTAVFETSQFLIFSYPTCPLFDLLIPPNVSPPLHPTIHRFITTISHQIEDSKSVKMDAKEMEQLLREVRTVLNPYLHSIHLLQHIWLGVCICTT